MNDRWIDLVYSINIIIDARVNIRFYDSASVAIADVPTDMSPSLEV